MRLLPRSAATTGLLTGLLGFVALTSLASAQNFFVAPGGVGDWAVATNWSQGHLPQAGETVFIHAGREATVNSMNPSPFSGLRVADHDVGAIDGKLNILDGAELDITGQILLSAGGASGTYGVIEQSGGNVVVSDAVFLAFDDTNSADYRISGGVLTTNNLWFRFGNAVLTQTGGVVNVQDLVLAEGGSALTSSFYDLQSGELNIVGVANIGKAKGVGDPFAGGSLGSMSISGGVATMGELQFGADPTDAITLSGAGVLRVNQSTFSEANAMQAIADGNLLGAGLMVNSVLIGMDWYTQISAVPEPTTAVLLVIMTATFTAARHCRSRQD